MAKKTTSKKAKPRAMSSGTKKAAGTRGIRLREKAAPVRGGSKKSGGGATRGIRVPRSTSPAKQAKPAAKRATPAARRSAIKDVGGAEVRRDIGGVRLEAGRVGSGRVKRMIYPPGYKWSTDTKPVVGTDYCMHAHVGFLVEGRIDVVYPDGCIEVFEAPHIVSVAPGHDGHVVGKEPAVLIEFDFESDTISKFGMPDAHRHE